jgi:hypothetical protein
MKTKSLTNQTLDILTVFFFCVSAFQGVSSYSDLQAYVSFLVYSVLAPGGSET